jgi:hypothetical protein
VGDVGHFGNAKFPHLLVQEGKRGSLYLLNRESLGRRLEKTNEVVGELPEAFKGGVWGAASMWRIASVPSDGLPPEGTRIGLGQVITVSVRFNSPTRRGFNRSIELTTQAGTIKIPISATATAVPPSGGTVTAASLVTGSVTPGLTAISEPLPSLTHLQIRAKASRLSSYLRKLVIAYMLSAPATVAMMVEGRMISHLCKPASQVLALGAQEDQV